MAPTIEGQVIKIPFTVKESDWSGVFDRLEVWRATAADGPYTALTQLAWAGARVPADIVGPPPAVQPTGPGVSLVGLTLSVLLDEQTQVDVTFTGTNPLTYAQAVAQINAHSAGLITSFVASDGRFVLESVETGNKAILRVLATDAAALLGLPTTSPAWVGYGLDADFLLATGVSQYLFTDYHSDPSFFYKTRFINAASGAVSGFSSAVPATAPGILDPSLLILGTVDLVDLQGRPIEGRQVIVYTKFDGTIEGGFALVPTDQRVLTDSNGHVQFQLIRGTTVTVAIAGTKLVRDITVPTDATLSSFNMLDPGVGSDDVFVVQVPNIDYAVRRTL